MDGSILTNLATTLLQCNIADDCEDVCGKLSNHVKGVDVDIK